MIDCILENLNTDEVAKLIGIMAHFVYWAVLGEFNKLDLDAFHQKSLLINLV